MQDGSSVNYLQRSVGLGGPIRSAEGSMETASASCCAKSKRCTNDETWLLLVASNNVHPSCVII